MPKKSHIGIYAASFALWLLTTIALGAMYFSGAIRPDDDAAVHSATRIGIYAFGQFAVVHAIYNCLLLARMWSAIQDGQTRITVGRAIGFTFIPLFNFYWIFRAWASYPVEYNRYVDRYDLPVAPLAGGWFVAYPLLMTLAWILYVPLLVVPFVFFVVVSKSCRAVGALDEAVRDRREQLAARDAPERLRDENSKVI